MIVRLPHSLALSRQVPVRGSLFVQVATSAFEVMMTGFSAVPSTKIWPPRATARLPPTPVSEATIVPAWMRRVAPGRT
jgi:hypothetical protein